MIWIHRDRPTAAEITAFGREHALPPLAVEDAIEQNQRAKFERYGAGAFLVLRPASLDTEAPLPAEIDDLVHIGELHVFFRPGLVLTLAHSGPTDIDRIRATAEADPTYAGWPVATAVHRILDRVVDGYDPVLAALEDRTDALEEQLYSGDPLRSTDIYHLSRELIELDRSVQPLAALARHVTASFDEHGVDRELLRRMRDVTDHITAAIERSVRLRALVREIFTVNATVVAERQNDQMKKISAWAGILFFPSLVAGVYGMNFTHMPELHWLLGYPMALALMLTGCVVMYTIFRKVDWI